MGFASSALVPKKTSPPFAAIFTMPSRLANGRSDDSFPEEPGPSELEQANRLREMRTRKR